MRMGAGARAMSMGNAYTAVEGDIYSSYFNPAGLAAMETRQLALSARYLNFDRNFKYLAFGSRIGPDADFAFTWLRAGTDDIKGRDLSGNVTGSLKDQRNSLTLTFSKSIGNYVSIGINTKLAYWELAGERAKAMGFDLGTIVRPAEHVTLSFVLRDINSRFTWNNNYWKDKLQSADGQSIEKEDKFPVYYTLGAAWKTYRDRLVFSATTEHVEDNPMAINLGTSYKAHERFTLRGGIYHYTSEEKFDSGSLTFGFTIEATKTMSFDYAYVPEDFADNSVHVISLLMNMGE